MNKNLLLAFFSTSILISLSNFAVAQGMYSFLPPITTVKPGKEKMGITSSQTEFGALAIPHQAKRILITHIEEDCTFEQPLFKFDFKEPVRLIIKNENSYAVKLMFTTLEKPQEVISFYKTVPLPANKKSSHVVKVAPNGKYTLNWFFNRKKYFKWICYNHDNSIIGITEVQVGNAKKKVAKKLEDLYKPKNKNTVNLPPPPPGF